VNAGRLHRHRRAGRRSPDPHRVPVSRVQDRPAPSGARTLMATICFSRRFAGWTPSPLRSP